MNNENKAGNKPLNIESWSAWSGEAKNKNAWRAFFVENRILGEGLTPDLAAEKADVAFLPAMQRRRLSPLARAALHVINDCCDDASKYPSIFCSIHGEIKRTHSLVEAIAVGEEVSPMAFSLSVHNAISGQFSIIFNNQQSTVATSPANSGYLSAFADARGLLNEGADKVILVFYEEDLPAFYHDFLDARSRIPGPIALAVMVSLAKEVDTAGAYQLSFEVQSSEPTRRLPLVDLIEFIVNKRPRFHQSYWQLNQV